MQPEEKALASRIKSPTLYEPNMEGQDIPVLTSRCAAAIIHYFRLQININPYWKTQKIVSFRIQRDAHFIFIIIQRSHLEFVIACRYWRV